jgi:hypothetical protein
MGTSASILFHFTATDPNRLISVNSVPGKREEQSAYRSELAGVSGSLSLIAAVCMVHDIHTGSTTIGLDREQAMIAASEDWPLSPARPDYYDLLTDIRAKVRGLPIKVHWKWIKGHQDGGPSHASLDEWAQANIYMDSMAKAYWNYLNDTGHCPSPQRSEDENWSISFQDNKLSRVDKKPLYDAVMEPTSKSYWQRRGNMSASNISTIDWELIGKAFTNLTTAKKRRVTKHASGHFGCGRMMQIWQLQDHAECHRCPEQDEDPPHILNCPAPSATLRWEKALTVLEVWMTAHHTMPELMTALLRCLHKWKYPNPSRRFACAAINTRYGLQAAILEQDDIGWYNFLMGRPSVRWRDVQHQYYEWLQRRNTGKAWLQALVKKVWEVSWDMWDHRNEVRTTTITPAGRETENLNEQIIEQFEEGAAGLGQKDHHLLAKPLAHVLGYDLDHKSQWLDSIALARIRFVNRHEVESPSILTSRSLCLPGCPMGRDPLDRSVRRLLKVRALLCAFFGHRPGGTINDIVGFQVPSCHLTDVGRIRLVVENLMTRM